MAREDIFSEFLLLKRALVMVRWLLIFLYTDTLGEPREESSVSKISLNYDFFGSPFRRIYLVNIYLSMVERDKLVIQTWELQ